MTIPEFVFISGWGTTQAVWNPVLHALDRLSRCLPWWRCLNSNAEHNALWRLLEASPEPVLLAGWSLGSLAALSAALNYPDKVAGIAVISGTARMTADGDYPGGDPRRLRAMRVRLKRDRDAVLKDFGSLAMAPAAIETFPEAFTQAARPLETDLLVEGLDYLLETDLRGRLGRLRIPALVVHGTQDQVIPFASGKHLADSLPMGKLREIPGGGHALLHTHSTAISDIIRTLANVTYHS